MKGRKGRILKGVLHKGLLVLGAVLLLEVPKQMAGPNLDFHACRSIWKEAVVT